MSYFPAFSGKPNREARKQKTEKENAKPAEIIKEFLRW